VAGFSDTIRIAGVLSIGLKVKSEFPDHGGFKAGAQLAIDRLKSRRPANP
jgi:hypothetical protein